MCNKKSLDILDIGCGVGGDINKFYHSRVGSYIGIDKDYANLFSAGDSATSRYNNNKKKFPGFTNMKFIQASATVEFNYINQYSMNSNTHFIFLKIKYIIFNCLTGNNIV